MELTRDQANALEDVNTDGYGIAGTAAAKYYGSLVRRGLLRKVPMYAADYGRARRDTVYMLTMRGAKAVAEIKSLRARGN